MAPDGRKDKHGQTYIPRGDIFLFFFGGGGGGGGGGGARVALLLHCCFTSTVNTKGHVRTVS